MVSINPNDIINQVNSNVQTVQQNAQSTVANAQSVAVGAVANAQSVAAGAVGNVKDSINNIKGIISKFKSIKPIKLKELPTPKKFKNKKTI
jgi:hypothetical protein